MIEWISGWAQGIIIAVVITVILEMIMPSGTFKKYLKVIAGIYIVFTIINPIINKFSFGVNLNEMFDNEKYNKSLDESNTDINKKIENSNSKTIKDIYKENIEKDVKNKLKQKGFDISSEYVNVSEENDEYSIKEIRVSLRKTNDENTSKTNAIVKDININEIEINSNKNKKGKMSDDLKLSNDEKLGIKQFLADEYNINKNKITIE